VFSEDSVTPTELKTLEKHSFATHTFIIPKKDFDIFTISNAVQAKNKKLL
jgi:ureidoglycolate hydrolase